jgi:hypothetical protein
VTPHREVFSRLVDELTRLMEEVAARRTHASYEVDRRLSFLDQSAELFAVKEWRGLLAANEQRITQWHVETAEMMVDLANRALAMVRGPPAR